MHKMVITWSDRVRNFRGLIIGLTIALLASTLPATNSPFILNAEASYGDLTCELTGDGSPPNPFQIGTAANLWEVIDCIDPFNTQYFLVTADIQTDGTGVTAYPIGVRDGKSTLTFENAWIDGQGYEISYSMSVNLAAAGLFHSLEDVTISNVILRGSVTETGALRSDAANTGGLAHKADGVVVLQSISAFVNVAGDENVGGLFGMWGGLSPSTGKLRMENVSNFGQVTGSSGIAGGLIGYATEDYELSSVSNAATISGSLYVGGLIGQSRYRTATLSHSVNSGAISSTNGYLGGIIGVTSGAVTISMTSVINTGPVSSPSANGVVGGLIGYGAAGANLSLVSVSNQAPIVGDDSTGGIIGDYRGSRLEISASQNIGAVSGANNVGGLAGKLDGSGVATLSDVANLSSVDGSENIGGLVGLTDIETRLVRAKNESSVQASTDIAGGLVGYANEDANLSIEISFNSGTVTVTNSNKKAGGLLGWSEGSPYSIVDSYNSGQIVSDRIGPIVGWDASGSVGDVMTRVAAFPASSQATTEDGLVAGNTSDVTVTAVYTFEASTLVSSSSVAELKSASTYTGWDFDSVWAFGGCDLNSGFPVLRWANEGVTFFDESCGVNSSSSPVVSSGGSGGSTPAPSRTPTAYSGPMLDAHKVVVQPGTANTILGRRLQTIHTVSIDGLSAPLVILTSTSLTITIPSSLTPGTHDLVVYSAHGKLTVNAKYQVLESDSPTIEMEPDAPEPSVPSKNFGVLLGFKWSEKFSGNSRELSPAQARGVEGSLTGFPHATTVVCWGYTTEESPSDWAIEHATERAASLCDSVATLRTDLRLFVRVRTGQSKFAAMRSTMQFWESKQPV